MQISYAWLQDFVSMSKSPEEIAAALTGAGLEVEAIEQKVAVEGGLALVVVGEVLSVVPHPGADRLRLCHVLVGGPEPVQIVCGASNVAAGQRVPVALPGAVLYPTGAAEPLKIKVGKIRGEVSAGMICAEDELGIGSSHEGILVLETDLPPGTPAAQALGLASDYVFEIGLTPNRGDAASHLGVARDLAALLNTTLCKPVEALPAGLGASELTVIIQQLGDAPHYNALLVTGVTVGPAPAWLQKRLAAIGVASINAVVDITNYCSHHLGQPMHAFDADKLEGNTLTVRRAGTASQLALLDKRTVTLHADDLVIADDSGPITLAGAMGGSATAVTDATTRIVLEVACFNPVAVRTTAARHGIKTDASFRFERGVDPSLATMALPLAARLLTELAGGAITQAPAVAEGNAIPARSFAINTDKLLGLIGQQIEKSLVEQILTSLGFGLQETAEGYLITVPAHRLYDVEGLADIAEEVLRIYGLNNLALPASVGVRFFDAAPGWDYYDKQALAAQLLAADGYIELVTNSLAPADPQATSLLAGWQPVPLLNPLSEELAQMRTCPLPATLQAIAYNANRRQKALKTFEFGRVYGQLPNGTRAEQPYVCLAVWGQPDVAWQCKPEPYSYYTLAATVQKLAERLGIPLTYTPAQHPTQFATCTALYAGKKEIALLGEVSSPLTRGAGIKGPVFAAVLWWPAWVQLASKAIFKAAEPPRFPEVRRDLSLVVNEDISYADLHALAFTAERKLLKQVHLFDIFAGPTLGVGKKAYALAFTLAANDATLTDAQIDAAMERLENTFTQKAGAVVRR